MSVRSAIYQSNFVSKLVGDEHIETLSEAKLAHHVIREVTEPIAHVLHISLLIVGFEVPVIAGQDRTQLTDMEQHHVFHSLEGILGESLTEHSPLAAVHGLIDGVVGVVHALDGWESIVEGGFLETLAMSVDIVKTTVGVDGDEIRCDPDVGSVLAVQLVQP